MAHDEQGTSLAWRETLAVLSFMAGGVAIVVPSLVAGGILGHFPTDAMRVTYLTKEYLLASLLEGRLPLWNPFTHMGTPFVANMQWGVFYPFNLLLLPWPMTVAFNLFLGFHLGLAGACTYLLGRAWGLARFAAVVAGLSYMLSGRLVVYAWGSSSDQLAATAWVPLLLLLFVRAVNTKARWVEWTAAATAGFALQILSGHPQYTLYSALVLVAAATYLTAVGVRTERRFAIGPLLVVAVVLAGGVALAAVQILPTYEAATLSTRRFAWSMAGVPGPLAGSYNPIRLLTWLTPDVFGNAVSLPPALTDWLSLVLREHHGHEFRTYIGVLPLTLAVVSLGRWRTAWQVRFLWGVLLGSLLLALGSYGGVYDLATVVFPPLRPFHVPARFVTLSVFAAAMLAGFGADALTDAREFNLRRWSRALWATTVLALSIVVVLLVLRGQLLDFGARLAAPIFSSRPSGRLLDANARSGMILGAYHLAIREIMIMTAFLAATAWLFHTARRWGRRELGVLVVGITALDLAIHALPYTDWDYIEPYLDENLPLVRLMDSRPDARTLVLRRERDSPLDVIRPSENVFLHYRRFTASGYDSFELGTYRPLIEAVASEVRRGETFVSGLFGIRFILSEEALSAPGLVPRGRLGDGRIYEDLSALNLAYFASGLRVVDDWASAAAVVQRREIVPGRDIVIERNGRLGATGRPLQDVASPARQTGRVERVTWEPEKLVFRVSAATDGFFVVNDADYPGWRASVDGHLVPIFRANAFVRAAPVAAGDHLVEMRFMPGSLKMGVWISAASWLLGAGTVIAVWTRRRAAVRAIWRREG